MYFFCSLILLVFQGIGADATVRRQMRWTDCTNRASPVRVQTLSMTPDPIELPGTLTYQMRGYTNRTIGSSRLILDIERLGSWMNLPVPCIYNIGSCTYPDMCTMLDDMIRENWLGATRLVGQDIKNMLIRNGLNPGMCPQPPTVMNIPGDVLRLPVLPSALYWFAEGTYHANVRVVENSSGEELLCLDINLYVKQREEPCSGWLSCMFT